MASLALTSLARIGGKTVLAPRPYLPQGPTCSEDASAAAWQWEFKPATSEGEPIETTALIPFRFLLD